MISDYFTLSLRNIRKRKLRSWLTILGIFIAIATIFMLISISLGLDAAVKEQFRVLGADKFFIQPKGMAGGPGSGGAVELTVQDVEQIEKVSGIKSVSYDIIGNAEVSFKEQKRYVMAAGLPLEKIDVFKEISSYKADEGRLIRKGDEGNIMIGSQYKYNNFFRNPVKTGDKLSINGKELRVIGILASLGNPSDDRMVYMSEDDFKAIFNSGNRVDQIIIQIDSGQDINLVAENVKRSLARFRNVDADNPDFMLLTPEELLASFSTILNIVTAFLIGVAAISLLVGSIGIANTMYTSVLERTREIGVMKAVGAQNKDILSIFIIESGLLGLIGGIIGVVLGYAAAKAIEYIAVNQLQTNLLRAATPGYLIIGCLIFSFAIGALSGTWPAWRATKVRPVEALRYE